MLQGVFNERFLKIKVKIQIGTTQTTISSVYIHVLWYYRTESIIFQTVWDIDSAKSNENKSQNMT